MAGAALVPDRLYAWLTVTSGLLIVVLGAGLLRRALGHSGRGHRHVDELGHTHGHWHGHGHGMATPTMAIASHLTQRFSASMLKRPRLQELSRLLPLGAASGVCLLGIGIIARTLAAAM